MARSSFGVTVLTGLAGSGLAVVAARQTWSTASAPGLPVPPVDLQGSDAAPLALALALVALAAWGAVLVLRRTGRLVVSVIGLLSALGVVAVVLTTRSRLEDLAAEGLGSRSVETSVTWWPMVCAFGGAVAAACFVVALRRAGTWPEMNSRYDAPGAQERAQEGTSGEQDLWKALDEGHDPTA